MQNKTNIYILKLKNNKYYVGRTSKDINERFAEHLLGSGSQWTSLNYPINVLEIIPNCDAFDEDKYVKINMAKYGIDNVRGGSYTKINLTQQEINVLKQEIFGSSNKCFKCGSSDHYAKNCYVKQKKYYYYSYDSDSDSDYDSD